MYSNILIPWLSKIGSEAALLLASCDTSILLLKLLQTIVATIRV